MSSQWAPVTPDAHCELSYYSQPHDRVVLELQQRIYAVKWLFCLPTPLKSKCFQRFLGSVCGTQLQTKTVKAVLPVSVSAKQYA